MDLRLRVQRVAQVRHHRTAAPTDLELAFFDLRCGKELARVEIGRERRCVDIRVCQGDIAVRPHEINSVTAKKVPTFRLPQFRKARGPLRRSK